MPRPTKLASAAGIHAISVFGLGSFLASQLDPLTGFFIAHGRLS
jgi:hypothetical protein